MAPNKSKVEVWKEVQLRKYTTAEAEKKQSFSKRCRIGGNKAAIQKTINAAI